MMNEITKAVFVAITPSLSSLILQSSALPHTHNEFS